MFFILIRHHSNNLFTVKKFAFCQIFFVINVYLVWSSYFNIIPSEKIKVISLMFFLPINMNFDLFRWILLLLPFLIIVNSFINVALKESPTYFLLRTGNSTHWFHSLFAASFLFILTNLLLGFILTGLIVFSISIPNNVALDSTNLLYSLSTTGSWNFLVHLFFIFVLSIFFFILINTLFTFIIHNSTGAFLLTIVCILSAFTFVNIFPNSARWNSLTYSLLAFQQLNKVSFTWYYVSLLFCILFLYFLNSIIFKYRKEFLVKI